MPRWLVSQAEHSRVSLAMPVFLHVQRAALFECHSDASKWGAGGCNTSHKVCWRFEWPADIRARFKDGTPEAIFINELELAGMVINVWAVLLQAGHAVPGESVSVRGDNSTAVHWFNKAGSSSAGPAGA